MVQPKSACNITRQTYIVEVVGPAGAGKSTLSGVLLKNLHPLTPSHRLRPRVVSNLPFIIGTGFLLIPIIMRGTWSGIRFTKTEIARMIYLRGMHRRLLRQSQEMGPVLIDQGPIFYLAQIYEFGPAWLRNHRSQAWWSQTLCQWARTLDVIVWLDAPNELLLKRINARRTWHEVQEISHEAGIQTLLRNRKALETVLAQLTDHVPIEILKFKTDQESTEQITAAIQQAVIQRSRCEKHMQV